MKVLFFGTPQFAATVLSYLIDHDISIVGVVTKPDRPKGRSGKPQPSEVKTVAQERLSGVPVFQPEKVSSEEFSGELPEADLFVVVAYGEILKQHILDMPRYGCINVHGSILPKYRGAAPIQHCLIHGEKESGVTIMHMVRKMDAGEVIRIEKIPVSPNMTGGELYENLSQLGAKALYEVIQEYAEKGAVESTPQNEDQVTFAPRIEASDCELSLDQPVEKLHNRIRALSPKPGGWCWVQYRENRLRLKLLHTEVVHSSSKEKGFFCDQQGTLCLGGKDGVLQLNLLQLEGKKAMDGSQFLRGISLEELSLVY